MATFGNTTAEATATPASGGLANTTWGFKFTLSEAGLVSKLTTRFSNTATSHAACHAKGVIYSDSSGKPGTLLATGQEVDIADNAAAAWVDLPFAAPVSLAAGVYWLGSIHDAGAAGLQVRRNGTTSTGYQATKSGTTYASGPITPFGTPSSTGTYACSTYGTYTLPSACPINLLKTRIFNKGVIQSG